MSHPLVYAIGFLAQAFFSGRILVQWLLSERAKKVMSPNIFWVFSLIGSILLFVYGWLRDDFSIILGQFISYYIYIWNLSIKGIWSRLPRPLRWLIELLPVGATAMMLSDASAFVQHFFHNSDVPMWLLILGSLGQIIFTVRFVYQWYYSYRRHASILPIGFWIISLVGSGMIVLYAIIRRDPVLILGQSVGFVAYSRNIMLSLKKEKV
ncbi:MAG: lipid-A-disaccharide synthase N-terminal domain-containing protein [Prevotella sp.]|nr:lipid-A-disaccharide synthase N-terminal domain-containing protein [Prevotella sp.]